MLGRTDSRRRLLVLLVVMAVVAVAIVGRLAYWQIVERERLAAEAWSQVTVELEVPSRRGTVYDRSGTVILATSVDRDRLVAYPSEFSAKAREATTASLVEILGLDEVAAAELTMTLASDRAYVIIARDLEAATSDAIRAAFALGEIRHVRLEPEPIRVYPQPGGGPATTLAAQVVGFVNREGLGQYGIESSYQAELAGEPKVVTAQRDIARRTIPETAQVIDPGTPGEDVFLTIDSGLQLAVEQEVLAAWIADRATVVSAVVLDPYSGEIYAQASYPSYDANDYPAVAATQPALFRDPAIADVYEPGSVFKMLTAATALEQGTIDLGTNVKDVGTLMLDGGRTHVDNADRKGMGTISFEDAIAYSRNVVAAKTALALGDSTRDSAAILHEMWTRLGMGSPTGIDEAGEAAGIVHDPTIRTWREIDLANGAFGQGIAVTVMQLATAFAAMVNGGTLVQPHLVRGLGDQDVVPRSRGQVLDPALSDDLRGLMGHVVATVPLYRDRTLLEGYEVGGKTGTAQIWDASANEGQGAWKHNIFNYSFVGYIAREPGAPDLVVAIRISEARPTVARVGYLELPVASFELFRRVAHDAITTPGLLADRTLGPVVVAAGR
jgi:cell division protein FtsI/penicillin-binding protein 2